MTHDLMTASPSVAAWRCDPMTVSEIDAHPDAGRIWATIVAMRDACQEEIEAEAENHHDDGWNNAKDNCRATINYEIDILLQNEQVSDTLAAKIRAIGGAI